MDAFKAWYSWWCTLRVLIGASANETSTSGGEHQHAIKQLCSATYTTLPAELLLPVAAASTHSSSRPRTSIQHTSTINAFYPIALCPYRIAFALQAEEGDKPDDFGALPNFRVRVVPVLGTMPALFGQAIAAHTLCELAGQTISGVPAPRMGKSVLNKMINRFDHNEVTRGYLKKGERAMTPQEADFLLSDVWRNRSSISQIRLGGNRRMMFTRWRPERGNNPSNIVFVTDPERKQLEVRQHSSVHTHIELLRDGHNSIHAHGLVE